MEIELRSVPLEAFDDFVHAVEVPFGEEPRQEEIDLWRRSFEPERSIAAYDGDRIIGTASAFSLSLTVPGASLPTAGVTTVGVHPTHRRRGILRRMMGRQLEHVHELGEPLAALWASESSIYGRFGYGMAAPSTEISIDRTRTRLRREPESRGRILLVDREKAMDSVRSVYERVLPTRPGMYALTDAMWDESVADFEHHREGASRLFYALYESNAGVEGYVLYRLKADWADGLANGTVKVRQLMSTSREAYVALWQYCFGIDLMGKVEAWPRPLDEPLRYLLLDPRRLRTVVHDGLWLRIVDVERALAGRRYAASGRVVFEVRDDFGPWAAGRFELDATPDGAECHRTDRDADITLDVADLSAAYLGGVSFRTLEGVGLVDGDDDALTRADALFAWQPLPHCPRVF